MIVNVDDKVITWDNVKEINDHKLSLQQKFQTNKQRELFGNPGQHKRLVEN